jgi:hypothetical protein
MSIIFVGVIAEFVVVMLVANSIFKFVGVDFFGEIFSVSK